MLIFLLHYKIYITVIPCYIADHNSIIRSDFQDIDHVLQLPQGRDELLYSIESRDITYLVERNKKTLTVQFTVRIFLEYYLYLHLFSCLHFHQLPILLIIYISLIFTFFIIIMHYLYFHCLIHSFGCLFSPLQEVAITKSYPFLICTFSQYPRPSFTYTL